MFAINIQCRRHVKPTCKRSVAVTSGKLSQQQWMQETSSVFLQTDQGDHFLWEPQDMFIFVPPRCLRSHLWEKLIFESRTLRLLGCMSVWLPSQSVGSWRAGWSERQSPKKLNCFMTNQLLHFTNKHTFVVAGPHICNRCCRTWNILNFSAQSTESRHFFPWITFDHQVVHAVRLHELAQLFRPRQLGQPAFPHPRLQTIHSNRLL